LRFFLLFEGYLRLSLISCDVGKYDEASVWLSRALTVDENQLDANICLGDLYNRNSLADDAKRCYEKICSKVRKILHIFFIFFTITTKNHHDARSMLSLGNFYYSSMSSNTKSEITLKDSYKFFFHVLNDDIKNVYAANGLGMACAENKQINAAKDIFSKV
jgi:tetratricopeptide (TPR) repeat protein